MKTGELFPLEPEKTGASLNRGNSKQTYRTPKIFLDAVQARFGEIVFDLAAHSRNTVASNFFSKKDDSLRQDWTLLRGLLWLNPPFDTIAPWAEKCARSTSPLGPSERSILFLVPASVGSEWFFNFVHKKALVCPLRPRLSFDGKHPYPKDLMCCAYGVGEVGFEPWKWKDAWKDPRTGAIAA